MRHRQDEIKNKGFKMVEEREAINYAIGRNQPSIDFNKVKVGTKTLEDASLNLSTLKKINGTFADKTAILTALQNKDYNFLREVSNFFFETSGIYERLCKYFAHMYKYDWMVTPYISTDNPKEDKILGDFSKVLTYLDDTELKLLFGNIALSVIKNGAYYGYKVDLGDKLILQDLPIKYCRSRFFYNGTIPAVEFNMKFFDEQFGDINSRLKVLKMFPSEFAKGYSLYKENKLRPDFNGDTSGWYMLDPEQTVKFNLDGSDAPLIANVIPSILDLDEAKELDRKKTMQQLLKIVIQKIPLDKNNELIFDLDEMQDLHNNAVQMLKRAVGVDVITSFADIEVADLSDTGASTTKDDLVRVERTIFNEAGASRNLFNAEGSIALEKSIANDEASMTSLILQYESFVNTIIRSKFNKNKKITFRYQIIPTTIYNYQKLADAYQKQTTIGYSKFLPQIALGQSQSSILANAYFENEILHLSEIMIPPQSSNTMSNKTATSSGNSSQSNTTKSKTTIQETSGRKELPDDEKSDKTIQNRESMG